MIGNYKKHEQFLPIADLRQLHPGIFFIENIIMAEIVQPSDKIKLIFILF